MAILFATTRMISNAFSKWMLVVWTVFSALLGTVNASTTSSPAPVTTLASELILHNADTVFILVLSLLIGIPGILIICCCVRSLIAYRREKKIKANEEETDFRHPAPEHPPPRPFLQRDNTIAGPFQNPAFNGDEDEDGRQSRTVTPSFINTRVVDEPGFGNKQQRYKYIP